MLIFNEICVGSSKKMLIFKFLSWVEIRFGCKLKNAIDLSLKKLGTGLDRTKIAYINIFQIKVQVFWEGTKNLKVYNFDIQLFYKVILNYIQGKILLNFVAFSQYLNFKRKFWSFWEETKSMDIRFSLFFKVWIFWEGHKI